MKRITLPLFALTSALMLCGCSTISGGPFTHRDDYNPHRASLHFRAYSPLLADSRTIPDSGAFYRLQSNEAPVQDPAAVLSDLYSRGFDVRWAWYSPPRKGCWTPPSSIKGGELPTVFVVCLAHADRGLEDWFNYERIRRPDSFGCPSENTFYYP